MSLLFGRVLTRYVTEEEVKKTIGHVFLGGSRHDVSCVFNLCVLYMIIHQNIEVHRLWRHKQTTVYDIKHFKSRQRVAALLTSRHVTARSLI